MYLTSLELLLFHMIHWLKGKFVLNAAIAKCLMMTGVLQLSLIEKRPQFSECPSWHIDSENVQLGEDMQWFLFDQKWPVGCPKWAARKS